MIYSGIGTRALPAEAGVMLTNVATTLDQLGWTLRSGHAHGADAAFEKGSKKKEIFLPWEGYNGSYSNNSDMGVVAHTQLQYELAIKAYDDHPDRFKKPHWDRLSRGVKALMLRNVPIILGETLNDPVDMVITWHPDRAVTGGTGHGVCTAQSHDIPVFNIRWEEDKEALCVLLGTA